MAQVRITAALARRHHHLRAWSGHYATQTDRGPVHRSDECAKCRLAKSEGGKA